MKNQSLQRPLCIRCKNNKNIHEFYWRWQNKMNYQLYGICLECEEKEIEKSCESKEYKG